MSEAGPAAIDPMPCAECAEALTPRQTSHGRVWICEACRAGAATLAVIRRVAPADFVRELWQAAREHGHASVRSCPSCTQPLRAFGASEASVSPEVEVCCRCFFVWLGREALSALRLRAPSRSALREAAARLEAGSLGQAHHDARQARDSIAFALAAASDVAEALEAALSEPG